MKQMQLILKSIAMNIFGMMSSRSCINIYFLECVLFFQTDNSQHNKSLSI